LINSWVLYKPTRRELIEKESHQFKLFKPRCSWATKSRSQGSRIVKAMAKEKVVDIEAIMVMDEAAIEDAVDTVDHNTRNPTVNPKHQKGVEAMEIKEVVVEVEHMINHMFNVTIFINLVTTLWSLGTPTPTTMRRQIS